MIADEMKLMTADALKAARADHNEAKEEVLGLTNGTRHWRTRIPVQDRDSDVVLIRALNRIPEMLAHADALASMLREALANDAWCDVMPDGIGCKYCRSEAEAVYVDNLYSHVECDHAADCLVIRAGELPPPTNDNLRRQREVDHA
jgi:hypothetical protein